MESAVADSRWTVGVDEGASTAEAGGFLRLRDRGSEVRLDVEAASLEIVDGSASALDTLRADAALAIRDLPLAAVVSSLPTEVGSEPAWRSDLLQADDSLSGDLQVVVRAGRLAQPSAARAGWIAADGRSLLTAALGPAPGAPPSAALRELDLEVVLLPMLGGAREVAARLTLAEPLRLSALSELEALLRAGAVEGRARIDQPELADFVAFVRDRLPRTTEIAAPYTPAATGPLRLDAHVSGVLEDPLVVADGRWEPALGPTISPSHSGNVSAPSATITVDLDGHPLSSRWQASAALELPDLTVLGAGPLAEVVQRLGGAGAASEASPSEIMADVSGSLVADLRAKARGEDLRVETRAAARPLFVASAPDLRELVLEASHATGEPVQLQALRIGVADAALLVRGEIDLPAAGAAPRLRLRLESDGEAFGLTSLHGSVESDAESLVLDLDTIATRQGSGRLRLDLPLGSLHRLAAAEGLADTLTSWGVAPSENDPRLTASVSDFRLEARADVEGPVDPRAPPSEPTAALAASELETDLEIDPASPVDSRGSFEISRLELTQGDLAVSADSVRLSLADRALDIAPFAVRTRDQSLEASARLRIGAWQPGEPISALVERLDGSARGTVDTSLLTPFLAGGVAHGPAEVEIVLAGDGESLSGTLAVRAPEGEIRFLEPYATQVTALELDARLESGALAIDRAEAAVNRGRISMTGRVDPGSADLNVDLDAVRYRVDYGISTQLSGAFELQYDLESARGRLSGDAVLERGLLRRSIDLEREVLAFLRPESALLTASDSLAQDFELDLNVTTRRGVRVRNNVADLRVVWSPLRVRGTLAEPLIDGVLDVESGGLVSLYGQTVRLDQATITLSGQPGAQPSLDLVTTTSLEDPSVSRKPGSGLDPFARPEESQESRAGADQVAGGLAQYVGDRLLGSAGSEGIAVGNAFSVRPVLVLTETEPSARLVVTRALTEQLDLGASFNMRTAEDRTYLLDLHDLGRVPTFSAQLFTNDERNEGLTLQQVLETGGGHRDRQRVGHVRLRLVGDEHPEAPSRRRLVRAAGLGRGDPWTEDLEYDVEIDVEEAARRRGFPSPGVTVTTSERGKRVDLDIALELGPRATVDFAGLQPSQRQRSCDPQALPGRLLRAGLVA